MSEEGRPPSRLSFGFKPAAASSKAAPRPNIGPSAPAFGDASDDEDESSHAESSSIADNRLKPKDRRSNLDLLAPAKAATPATRNERKKQHEAQQLDASIFDYDGVYDTIKDAERKVKQARMAEDVTKKPKYIDGILESAEQRKRDRLRAEARTIQKQRQAEGDEFADKESFVTNAYKEQQAELAKAQEQQDKHDSQQRASSEGMGMASFYRNMLNETSAARDAAIAASLAKQPTTSAEKSSRDNVIKTRTEVRVRSDAELAKAASEKGLDVELNDDGEIVDKRSLLSKGLNVVTKRRTATDEPLSAPSERDSRESRKERDQRRQEEYQARMHRDAQRSRQSAQIEEQMLEMQRKRKLQEQEANRRERSKMDARRNDREAISQAKQRYLERKKQRLQGSQSSV